MSDAPLTNREVGMILARLEAIQESIERLHRLVNDHDAAINQMRGAIWLLSAVVPILVLVLSWLARRFG